MVSFIKRKEHGLMSVSSMCNGSGPFGSSSIWRDSCAASFENKYSTPAKRQATCHFRIHVNFLVAFRALPILMERAVTFRRSTQHVAALNEILVQAVQPGVRGRWQPNPMADWCDAWSDLSSCLYMAEGRAAHAEEQQALEALL